MNNFGVSYRKILELLQSVEAKMNFLRQIRISPLSDIELIALSLTAECMSVDSEYQLFHIMPDDVKSNIERSVYNCRHRELFPCPEKLRKLLAEQITPSPHYFIADSMPLEICKLSRISHSSICTEKYDSAQLCQDFR